MHALYSPSRFPSGSAGALNLFCLGNSTSYSSIFLYLFASTPTYPYLFLHTVATDSISGLPAASFCDPVSDVYAWNMLECADSPATLGMNIWEDPCARGRYVTAGRGLPHLAG